MKKMIFCICSILLNTSVAVAEEPTNNEREIFSAWCDAFTAQGLVSLAANRIFGNISTLNDKQYEVRNDWVTMNYGKAAERFRDRSGQDFEKIDGYALENGWVKQCQLKDQIQ